MPTDTQTVSSFTGCLGPYAQALLEHGQEVLPFLPPEAKSALLAIARRQVCSLLPY